MPRTEDHRQVLSRRYSETHARASAGTPTPEAFAYQARVLRARFAELMPADRGAAILELGCGVGAFLKFLQDDGWSRAAGVDSDAASIRAAGELGVRNAETGDLFDRLARERGALDAVVAVDVLEHFRKDELFPLLAAVRDALKPGGVLVWRAPNAEAPFFGRLRYGDLTHETAFTRHSAFQLMTAAGFDAVETRGDAPVVTGARSLVRKGVWAVLRAAARVYLWAESYETGAILDSNLIVRARKP